MDELGDRRRRAVAVLRVVLVASVLLWVFGPVVLRETVPIWVPFLIALGLEVQFFVRGLRPAVARKDRPDRGPQAVDRERYGYAADPEELLLVRGRDEELWIPYSGESKDEVEELVRTARDDAEAEELEWAGPLPERSLLRTVGRLAVGLGVIGALGLVAWLAGSRGGWSGLDPDARAVAEERFSEEASRIVERPVSIVCDESGDYVGVVQHADGAAPVAGSLAYLTPQRCLDLYRLAFEGEIVFSQTARSLAVLAHEAWHLRGVADEGLTECYALQSGVELGVRLGLHPDTAQRMMRSQLVENSGRLDVEYIVPPECRDGGELDLRPATSDFP